MCGSPLLGAALEEESRRVVTVVFCDLAGSTALGDGVDPEELRARMARYHERMREVAERHGGTLVKFIGDGAMSVFGVPVVHEDDVLRAGHAALEMQAGIAELGLSGRVGVNTGEVIVHGGDVTGDAVNVAARLEQAASPGEVLAGERTVAATRGAFELGERRTVAAKGKAEDVPCRAIVKALTLTQPRGVGGLREAFVGRETELAELERAFADVVSARRPQLVTILGEPGVGKSRLLREMAAWFSAQQPRPLRRMGRCPAYGRGVTYWPLAEILQEHFGLDEDETEETIAERLSEHPYLALTLGVDAQAGLHPLAARKRLHDAWSAFAGELVAAAPVVLMIEDVHWAEGELLDLLDTLVEEVTGPLLVLATARPEFLERRPRWAGGEGHLLIALDALPVDVAGRLLDELIGTALSGSIRDMVIERAEGNPFFVEELIATLIDREVLVHGDGGWSSGELPEGFGIPDTVNGVIAARLDLLAPDERTALQIASVIGRIFWTDPVYAVDPQMAPDMRLLEARGFIRRRVESSFGTRREYSFKHALTREVAYASLSRATRAHLHAALADWTVQHLDSGHERAAMLAHHYCAAVRPEDVDLAWADRSDELNRLCSAAVMWAREAASAAIGRYEIDEGIALLQQAAEHESDDARRVEICFEIGLANALKYDGHACIRAMERALQHGADPGFVYAELAYQAVQRGAMFNPPVWDAMDDWTAKAMAATEPGKLAHAKALVADTSRNDRPGSAHRALAIADDLGDDDLRSAALFTLTDASYWLGDLKTMDWAIKENVALLPRITDPDRRANIYVHAASFPALLGRFAECLDAAHRLTETVAGLTPHHRVHAIGPQVGLRVAMGRWHEVCELTPSAESTVDANLAAPCMINVLALLNCALGQQIAGDKTQSQRLEEKAEGFGLSGYDQGFFADRLELALARGDLGRVASLIDHMDEEWLPDHWVRVALLDGLIALGDLARAESIAADWVLPGTYIEPFALRSLGVARRERALIQQAIARYEEMGLDWHTEQTRQLLARV
jgi:class 3 adenylate cyclase